MFGKAKRTLALLLALSMLFSMMSMGVSATAEDPQAAQGSSPVLVLDERQMVNVDGESVTQAFFRFTATIDGTYLFTAHSDMDTYGHLYDEDMNELVNNDDDGIDSNFLITHYMTAGTTCILGARFYDESNAGSFEVSVSRSSIVSLEIEPITLLPDSNSNVSGSSDENGGWIYYPTYYWWNIMQGTVTFEDGSTESFTGTDFEHNGVCYQIDYINNQIYENRWLPGNTYTSSASIYGISAPVSVTILPSPVESVVLNDLDIPVNHFGYESEVWDDELQESRPFYVYSWASYADGVITFTDGTQQPINNGAFEYDGQVYYLQYMGNQQSDGQWTVGNTYTPAYAALGYAGNATVNIVETNVADMQIEPITIMLGQYGWEVTDENGNTYFHYNWGELLRGTVTYTDGTSVNFAGNQIDCDGEVIDTVRSDTQGFESPWIGGQTYTGNVSFMGYETQVSVTIESSPIQEIVVNDISITESTEGNMNTVWYEDGTSEDYFHYSWRDMLTGTVIMKDGNQYPIESAGFWLDGEWHGFESSDGQETNHWYAGNTYSPVIKVLGTEVAVNVTITETPVESISITPLDVIAGTMGYWSERFDPDTEEYQQFFEYYFWDYLSGTVHFKDGTSVPFNGSSFEYEGNYYSFAYNNPQHSQPWTEGNSYTVSLSAMGASTDLTVNIISSPISEISVEPITLIDHVDGYPDSYWDDENGCDVEYFRYNWDSAIRGTIHFTDGTSTPFTGMGFVYNGSYYNIDYTEIQMGNPWTVGNTYNVPISAMGYETTVSVTIDEKPSPDTFQKLQQDVNYTFPSDTMSAVNATFTPSQDGVYLFRYRTNCNVYVTISDIDGNVLNSTSGCEFTLSAYLNANTMYVLEMRTDTDDSFNLHISPSPIESISLDPQNIFEGTCGYWDSRWDEETQTEIPFYHYDWWNRLSGTVYFTDGTSTPINGTEYEYDGQFYNLDYDNPQYAEPWVVGGNYCPTVSCMGISACASVNIIASPITGISIEPIVLTELTGGYQSSYWDDENGCDVEYFHYEWQHRIRGVISFNDGSEVPFSGTYFEYNGMGYSLDINDIQQQDPWVVNHTYVVSVKALGFEGSVCVTIDPKPDPDTFLKLRQDVDYAFTTSDNMPVVQVTFTPAQDDTYNFSFRSDDHTYAKITTVDGDNVAESSGNNFILTPYLNGQTMYVLEVSMDNYSQFHLRISASPIASIALNPITLTENTNGYWDSRWDDEMNETRFYRYEWQSHVSGTVYFKDGTSMEFYGSGFHYNDQDYEVTFQDTQYEESWTVDNYYYPTVSCAGANTSVQVSITPSPIQSIVFNPLSIEQNTCGHWENYETGFYRYNWQERLSGTVYFTDGSSSAIYGSSFEYQGMNYGFSWDDMQYENPWTVNNTYTVTLSAMGFSADVTVSITEPNLTNIVLNPISIQKETGGHWRSDWWAESTQSYITYYHYEWMNCLSGTAYFRDGGSVEFTGTSFVYDGQSYNLEWSDDGQENAPWLVNNIYEIQLNVGHLTVTQDVSIQPPPAADTLPVLVEDVMTDISIQTGGEKSYLAFTPAQSGNYIFSSNGYYDTYGTIYDADWNKLAENDDGNSNGSNFQIIYSMTAGQTYILESRFYGDDTIGTFQVHCYIMPIASITVDPLTLIEGTNGNMQMHWNETTQQYESFFCYNWQSHISGTVYFTDGTSVPFNGTGYIRDGQYYPFNVTDGQYANPWQVGNTYTEQLSINGIFASINITVEESPVDYMEFDTVYLPENTGGYHTGDYVNGEYVPYYYYTSWLTDLTGTIYFKDGTSAPISGTSFTYNDQQYGIISYHNQSAANPWLPGNTYAADMTVMGVSAEAYITICRSTTSGDYSYIDQNGNAVITNCTANSTVLQIPDTLDGLPVTGIINLGEAMEYAQELIIPDSVSMLSGNALAWYEAPLKKLTIGAGITNLIPYTCFSMKYLEQIQVSPNNPNLVSIDNIVYDKAVTKLVLLPTVRSTTYQIPDSVTDISVLLNEPEAYAQIKFLPGAGTAGFTVIDGVVYNSVVTRVYSVAKERTDELVLPNTVTAINSHALAYSNLTGVTVPDSVTSIAYGAFYGSTSLQSVDMPETVTRISMHAFRDCSSLESIFIPASCEYITDGAFEGCTGLEAVYIRSLNDWCKTNFGGEHANPLYYAGNLYVNGEKVDDLVVPAAVGAEIKAFVFAGINAKSITIPEGVASIGICAFMDASATQVSLPDTLLYLDSEAFAGSALTSVTLPDSLTMVGGYVFEDCTDLEQINFGSKLPVIGTSMFKNTGLKQITIPATIEYISGGAFADCKQLTGVHFEGDSIEIGYGAFRNCPLRTIDLPSNTPYIYDNAFEGIAAASIDLGDTVTEITYRSFAFNENLMSVVIPESVETIINAFEGCDNLGHVMYEGTQEQWNNVNVYCDGILNANIHVESSAEDIIVRHYCHQIQHYCAVCNQWEYKDLDGTHNYVDGVCTICGYNEFSAYVGGESFETLEEAIEAADSNSTVELNNHIITDQLTLDSGKQLDLNGLSLDVTDGVVVFDGQIFDSSEGEGAIVMDKDALVLPKENEQMPLYDTSTGSYRFYSYTVKVKGVRENPDGSVTYGFRFDFGGHSAYEVLQATEDSGVSSLFTLEWGDNQQTYTFSNELIRQYGQLSDQYGDRAALMVTITGLDTLEPGTEMTAVAGIYSDLGIHKTGSDMVYTTSEE